MNLVICDDEKEAYEWLKRAIVTWAQSKNELVQLKYYESAEELLFKKEEWTDCDGMILDIELKAMNGMQLAKRIRATDEKLPLLFVTGYEQFVFEGYDVGAVSYLLKPVNEQKLWEALNRMQELTRKNKDLILVSTSDSYEKVYLNDLIYIESDRHNCTLQTTNGTVVTGMGISQFTEMLADKGFCMPHRSYLVNISHIRKITKQMVSLDKGYEVPIARGKWESISQSYLEYYRRGRSV